MNNITPDLKVGDVCWCMEDFAIFIVRITDITTYGDNDASNPFHLYTVTTGTDAVERFGRSVPVNRTNLFKWPDEADALRARCKDIEGTFHYYQSLLKNNQKPEPEIICGVKLIDLERNVAPELGRWYADL